MSPPPPQDPDRWRQIEPILDQALDLLPGERGAFLNTACGGDTALRAEVEALLAADERAGNFLGAPAGEYAADLLAADTGEIEGEESLEGCQVGPYRLLREVGCGGMGVVYEAEDSRLGRRVAVKFLPREYSRDRKAKERFLREARAASAVDHPNLCTVHDVGEWEGRLYTVLTYYEGETLKERLRRGPMSIIEARDVAIQMARGLARAHDAGIVHRDIKPSNVILTRRGEVKILDFGIAKRDNEEITLTPTGSSWGTPAYMSPEQIRGEPVDGRTDVWSLGVVMYEMLAGRRPFGGEGVQEMLSSILIRVPELFASVRPEVPQALSEAVFKALAKDRDRRYASAAELLTDLESGKRPGAPWWSRLGWNKLRKQAVVLRTTLLGTGVLAAAVLGALIFQTALPSQDETPLRVALRYPIVEANGAPGIESASSEIMEATLATLLSFKGLQPLDPPREDRDTPEERRSAEEIARRRAQEADEELLSILECQPGWCQVSFRRVRSGDEVLATVGPFEVLTGVDEAVRLTEGIRTHLKRIYPDHRLRADMPGLRVRPQDYSAYIKLERRLDEGGRLGVAELDQLATLLQSSPNLLGAHLLLAGTANDLGERYRDRALHHVAQAHALAPYDPEPLFVRFRIEMDGDRSDAAQATLVQLQNLAPNDPRVLIAEADLLERRGQLNAARVLRQKVVQRRPAWRWILNLARLELLMGESNSARRRLGDLRREQPYNIWVLDHLAFYERSFGDLARAATIYDQLIQKEPRRSYFNNRGDIHYLQAHYAAAEDDYRRGLRLEPDHPLTRFNLAKALEAQGKAAEAKDLFRALVKEFQTSKGSAEIRKPMFHAQCLIRLGFIAEAVPLVEEAVQGLPEDVNSLHEAAQVYALLGERRAALYYIESGLKKGLVPEWFKTPEFRSLEHDLEFQALLDLPTTR